MQAVIVPSVQESLHATQFIGQQPHALTATSSGIAYAGPSTSNPDHQIVFGKRLHDDVDVYEFFHCDDCHRRVCAPLLGFMLCVPIVSTSLWCLVGTTFGCGVFYISYVVLISIRKP